MTNKFWDRLFVTLPLSNSENDFDDLREALERIETSGTLHILIPRVKDSKHRWHAPKHLQISANNFKNSSIDAFIESLNIQYNFQA